MYPHEKRPPVPKEPIPPPDKASLKEAVKGVTAGMNSEWVHEGETSPEIIQFHTPSLTIPCFIDGIAVIAFYNPTVGVNIISASSASDHSGERHLLQPRNPLELDYAPL